LVKGGTTYRILADQVGSVRLVVNASTGAIAQRIDYDAFGVVTTDTNPGFQPFGFAGGLTDLDTGLVRFGARDYDPRVGRWTSKDPIGFASRDTNLFAYVLSDPVQLTDPSGESFTVGLTAAGAATGALANLGYQLGKGCGFNRDDFLNAVVIGAAIGFGLGAVLDTAGVASITLGGGIFGTTSLGALPTSTGAAVLGGGLGFLTGREAGLQARMSEQGQ
jgi:RHS repeat-associated protein